MYQVVVFLGCLLSQKQANLRSYLLLK
jgi:hypothetical protein